MIWVTYDDSGKIIPLSQRFNAANNDIRYSERDENGVIHLESDEEFWDEGEHITKGFNINDGEFKGSDFSYKKVITTLDDDGLPMKKGETRAKRVPSLDKIVRSGERVAILQSGVKGSYTAYAATKLGEPEWISAEDWDSWRDRTQVPEGSDYDLKEGMAGKWYYPFEDLHVLEDEVKPKTNFPGGGKFADRIYDEDKTPEKGFGTLVRYGNINYYLAGGITLPNKTFLNSFQSIAATWNSDKRGMMLESEVNGYKTMYMVLSPYDYQIYSISKRVNIKWKKVQNGRRNNRGNTRQIRGIWNGRNNNGSHYVSRSGKQVSAASGSVNVRGASAGEETKSGNDGLLGSEQSSIKGKAAERIAVLTESEKKAVEIFGTTEDFNEAGYILSDGTLLKMTDADHKGQRSYDHRAIAAAYGKEINLKKNHGFDMYAAPYLERFVQEGAIRLDTGDLDYNLDMGIHLSSSVPPTAEQISRIKELIYWKKSREESYKAPDGFEDFSSGVQKFLIEFGGNSNYAVGSVSRKDLNSLGVDALVYDGEKIWTQKVVNDIRHYYRTGEIVQQNPLSRFYSEHSGARSDEEILNEAYDDSATTEVQKKALTSYREQVARWEAARDKLAEAKRVQSKQKKAAGTVTKETRLAVSGAQAEERREFKVLNGMIKNNTGLRSVINAERMLCSRQLTGEQKAERSVCSAHLMSMRFKSSS